VAWWSDVSNAALRKLKDTDDAAPGNRLRNLYAPSGLTLYKYRAYSHLLAQLRTGVCARWGGWAHDGRDVECRLCGEPALRRDGEAIEHLFDCQSDVARQLRAEHLDGDNPEQGTTPVVLWSQPKNAAFYASAMIAAAAVRPLAGDSTTVGAAVDSDEDSSGDAESEGE